MTRQQLKSIVKECLLEILREGLGPANMGAQSAPIITSTMQKQGSQAMLLKQQAQLNKKRVSPLDSPATPYNHRTNFNAKNMSEAIRRESNGDKVMESIFADTARNTLPTMLSNGDSSMSSDSGRSAHSIAQQEQFVGSPEQVFGEDAASKWANLAFTDFKTKNLT